MYKLAEVSWVITVNGIEVLNSMTDDYAAAHLRGQIFSADALCDADGVVLERTSNEIIYMTRIGLLEVMSPDDDVLDSGSYSDKKLLKEHYWSEVKLDRIRKIVTKPQFTWGEVADFFKPIC